jgi:putative hydrolase of the HAD superfamily
MNSNFDGIAFDLDGTLYPNYQLYIRLIPFILREFPLLIALGKARDRIRAKARDDSPLNAFYDIQARHMAELLRGDPSRIKSRTEELIYRGWEPLFKKISLYPGVRQTLEQFRERGFKLGILSDFPPENKLVNLDLAEYFDVLLCSETIGRLKPNPLPFVELAKTMNVAPERILYVGNSISYDIVGAKGAGMKAALVTSAFKKKRSRTGNADFVFSDYRQLSAYVIP